MENIAYKKFIRFLKNEGAFIAFKFNFKTQVNIRKSWANGSKEKFIDCEKVEGMKDFSFNIKDKGDLLNWAFSWAETKQGHEFWEKLSAKWVNSFKKN